MNNKVTTGKKDVLGQPIIGGFEGTREIQTGSLIKLFRANSIVFAHHGIESAQIKVRKFPADKHCNAFQVLELVGKDKNGVKVEVSFFLDENAPINLIPERG